MSIAMESRVHEQCDKTPGAVVSLEKEQGGQGHHEQKHLLLSKSSFNNKPALFPKSVLAAPI